MLRPRSLLLSIAVIFVVTPYLLSLYKSAHYLNSGVEAYWRGDIRQALIHYREALSWDAPSNVFAEQGHDMLRTFAFHEGIDRAVALQALNEFERGLMRSRSWISDPSEIEAVRVRRNLLLTGNALLPVFEKDALEISYGYLGLAHLFFWSWCALAVQSIWRGLTPDGAVAWRKLMPGAAATVVCYAGWLVCLTLA